MSGGKKFLEGMWRAGVPIIEGLLSETVAANSVRAALPARTGLQPPRISTQSLPIQPSGGATPSIPYTSGFSSLAARGAGRPQVPVVRSNFRGSSWPLPVRNSINPSSFQRSGGGLLSALSGSPTVGYQRGFSSNAAVGSDLEMLPEDLSSISMDVATRTNLGYTKPELQEILEEEERKLLQNPGIPTPSRFLKPSNSNVLTEVSNQDVIGDASVLAMFPITTRTDDKAKVELQSFKKLLGERTFDSLDRSCRGVVAYVPGVNIHFDNIGTLRWLIDPKISNIPEEIHELYNKFMKPKLYNNGKIVSPQIFEGAKFLTGSFSNRKVDMLLALMHEDISKAKMKGEVKDDIKAYLEKIYVISISANPYNWVKKWTGANEQWGPDIQKYVRSDVIMSSWDCLTRTPSEVIPLLQKAKYNNSNIYKFGERGFRIVTPRVAGNYYGHNVDHSIDALITANEHRPFISALGSYFRGDISLEQFHKYRGLGAVEFDPSVKMQNTPRDNVTGRTQEHNRSIRDTADMLNQEFKQAPDLGVYKFNPDTHLLVGQGRGKPHTKGI